MIHLTLPVPPSGNRYWHLVRSRAGRTHHAHTAEARRYLAEVRNRCMIARVRPISGDVEVSVVWWRAKRTGDLDNRLKVLLDSLGGHAYADDAKVRRITAEMRDDDPCGARVEVVIVPFGEIERRGVGL